jgi:HPt (histidine-containing phosphotransfer) domain-containing protein
MMGGGDNWTPASLTERLGGDEHLARELVHIFLVEYRALLQAVLIHVSRGDVALVRRAAHALRGATTNFIDGGPTATALALERAAGESPPADLAQLAGQLTQEVEALAEAMRRFKGADPCAS